jgi:hypothetical protein
VAAGTVTGMARLIRTFNDGIDSFIVFSHYGAALFWAGAKVSRAIYLMPARKMTEAVGLYSRPVFKFGQVLSHAK